MNIPPSPTTGNQAWYGDAADAYARGLANGAAAEGERIRQYITGRQEGLNTDDPFERGKHMALLGLLLFLDGQP